MLYTKHGTARANQRGFSADSIELIREFGGWDGDKQQLGRRELITIIEGLDRLRRKMTHLLDKGGGYIVCSPEGRLVTVYTPRKTSREKKPRKLENNPAWS